MKYRELLPNEIEAYNIGYKNGSRQAVIKVLEYETPEEKMFYRQGYNAGCQDRKRRNVSTCEIGSNVSNVSNVKSYDSGVSCESCDSTIANNNTITNTIVDSKESIGGVGGKRETIDENTPFKAGGQMWTMPLQFRKLAKKYWAESEIREIEIEHSCHEEPVELTIKDLLTIKPPKPKKKDFVPPTLEEWRSFCKELKLDLKRLESIYYGYSENNWRDSHGNQIKNWKMKIRQVWDKPENKDPYADIPSEPQIADKSNFVRAKPL